MSRTVLCRKYHTEMEGLASPPLPGPKGIDLFEHVSAQAWKEWLSHQTMLINEKQLSLMDLTARAYLSEQMEKFLSGESYDQADGYVAPNATATESKD